jgi:hypothetical protein
VRIRGCAATVTFEGKPERLILKPDPQINACAHKPRSVSVSFKWFFRVFNSLHKYIGLLVFGQVLLWSIGGFLMYSLDFSDLYADPQPLPLVFKEPSLSPQTLQTRLNELVPGSRLLKIEVRNLAGQMVYLLSHTGGGTLLLNVHAVRLNPLSLDLARTVAQAGYIGAGKMTQLELLPKSAGNYFSAVPVYRAQFNDSQKTEIYIDPQTGALLARRKALWSLYNRMWEFHLMKYTPSKEFNKSLLLLFAVLNGLVALTGFLKIFRKNKLC